MIRLIERIALLVLVALAFAGCATTTDSPPTPEVKNDALRVGVSPDYPPMVFKQNDRITGAEADLALRLGDALGSPVEFVELAWDQLIASLMEGKIDIIMSGMTITEARRVRINFTDHCADAVKQLSGTRPGSFQQSALNCGLSHSKQSQYRCAGEGGSNAFFGNFREYAQILAKWH